MYSEKYIEIVSGYSEIIDKKISVLRLLTKIFEINNRLKKFFLEKLK